jgi:hypothetical protein
MALLDEKNLVAEAAKRARFRLRHVGTKLNEAESRALDELAAKRKQTQAELIRGLILAEVGREKAGAQPSPEMIEIVACRLLVTHALRPLMMSQPMGAEAYDNLVAEIKQHKVRVAGERLQEYTARPATRRG